jgi:23S rRNA (uracil1939-C5)-methyltransferase
LREAAIQPPAPPNPGFNRFAVYARGGSLLSEGAVRGKIIRRGKVSLRDKEIHMDARVFFQSNAFMLEKLIGDLLGVAQGADASRPMADLYCGVGVFAAFLGALFPRADLVEMSSAAIALARENTRGMNAELFAQTGDLWAKGRSLDDYGFVVADPPRQGLSPTLRRALAEKGPPVFAYVSCESATLARDSGELIAGGYRLEQLTGYDFYPQTSHIESLAVFRR